MPLFEYRCSVCNNVDEKLEFGNEMEQEHFCSLCDGASNRIVSMGRFELKYNNKTDICSWGNEGYASSQYWNAYKAARARGEDVKPAGED
jgi:putative FmdB family regulatory protein